MPSNTEAETIDLSSIWSGVSRSLPVLMLCTILSGVLAYAALSIVAKRYEANTQLTITAKTTNPYAASKLDIRGSGSVAPRLDPAAINTHVRALMAPDLLLKVGQSLNLSRYPEFNGVVGPVDTADRMLRMIGIGVPKASTTVEDRMLEAMRDKLTVSAARESRFITIKFTATDPQVAADVANGIATTYRQSLREIPVRETNEAVEALLPKIKQLSQEVFEAEAIAKRFRAESDQLTGGAASLTLQEQRLSALNTAFLTAEAERSRSEARLAAARELAVRGNADTLPEVQQSRIIQDLMSQKVRVDRQVNEARAVLLPAHPRMLQLNADLNGLRRSIRSEIATIVDSISKEVRLSQLRSEQLRGQIAELKKSAIGKSTDQAKLQALETTATSKRNELERLQKQLEDNRTVVDTNRVPVESTIVSKARAAKSAIFPKKTSSTIIVMAATMMLGFAFSIARQLIVSGGPAPHNRRASDKRGHSGGAKLTSAPLSSSKTSNSHEDKPLLAGSRESPVMPSLRKGLQPTAQHTETIAGVAQRFLMEEPQEGGFRSLIAGGTPDVDPSDEAVELAGTLSEAGARVLLIDWAVDGKPLLSNVAVEDVASVADLIADQAEFDDILIALPDSSVHYARACTGPSELQLLDGDGVNLVLDALDEAYDHVVIFGRYADAMSVFEVIEGRFDAGITVADSSVGTHPTSTDSFLGFAVTDIDIIHYVRTVKPARARSRQSVLQPV